VTITKLEEGTVQINASRNPVTRQTKILTWKHR
jgi:hypothetical protein